MKRPPKRFQVFVRDFPKVAGAYEALGEACRDAGPLDDRTRALVKLALSTGARMEGAVHAHTRKALAQGIEPEALRQVALLSIPTIGFPAAMAALSWIDDLLPRSRSKHRRNPVS
jgi:alkylhydroperoxidase/carboxymuconolactone decarboxylase family protein YurZ